MNEPLTPKEVNQLWLDILEARAEIEDYNERAADAQRNINESIERLKILEPNIENMITERLNEAIHDEPEPTAPKEAKAELTEIQLNEILSKLSKNFKQGDVMKLVTPLNGSIKQFIDHFEGQKKIQFVSGKGNGRSFKKL